MGFSQYSWSAEYHYLQTRLTPEAYCERLQPHVASTFAFRTDLPLRGSVRDDGFALRKAITHRNSFQTQAVGRFESVEGGTRVRVRLGLSRSVGVALTVCHAVAAIYTLLTLYLWLHSPQSRVDPFAFAWGPLSASGIFLFGICGYAFARWTARDEASFLLQSPKEALEATEVPPT